MRYSVIVPVYNRPDEVDELLQSLMQQTYTDFEVIIVEDGSAVPCKDVVDKYAASMNIRYYSKPIPDRGSQETMVRREVMESIL